MVAAAAIAAMLTAAAATGAGAGRPVHLVHVLADDLGYNDVQWHNASDVCPPSVALSTAHPPTHNRTTTMFRRTARCYRCAGRRLVNTLLTRTHTAAATAITTHTHTHTNCTTSVPPFAPFSR